MNEQLSPSGFAQAEGVEDWRVLSEGACAFFRTNSFAERARLVQAISRLGDIGEHPPDIDVRPDGVTVRLVTCTDDYGD